MTAKTEKKKKEKGNTRLRNKLLKKNFNEIIFKLQN